MQKIIKYCCILLFFLSFLLEDDEPLIKSVCFFLFLLLWIRYWFFYLFIFHFIIRILLKFRERLSFLLYFDLKRVEYLSEDVIFIFWSLPMFVDDWMISIFYHVLSSSILKLFGHFGPFLAIFEDIVD